MICWMRRPPPPWRKPLAAWSFAAGALALLADVHPAMTQTPLDLFRERTAVAAAGERCGLFDEGLSAALASGQAQARTGALRAGYSAQALERGAAEARAQVAALPCGSARVQQAAERAREAFRAYASLQRIAFPGELKGWRADRAMPRRSASWRLAQEAWAGQDKVVFGLAGLRGAESMVLTVAPADGARPYAARLVVRDPARLPEPLLRPARSPLAARAPLPAAARVILAEAKAPADPALRPAGAREALAFRFPAEARAAIERLDPREAFGVELLYAERGGDAVRTAFLEVGDFRAGEVFLNSAAR